MDLGPYTIVGTLTRWRFPKVRDPADAPACPGLSIVVMTILASVERLEQRAPNSAFVRPRTIDPVLLAALRSILA